MTRILLRSKQLLTASVLVLLAGVVVLSAATRRPNVQACSGPWHLWKVGRMTKSEGEEVCKWRVAAQAEAPQTAPNVSPVAPVLIYCPHEETIPPALSAPVVQIRHLRAPPYVG